ncbi:TPA: HNH endonuclease [Clostridium sporogenes]
MLLKTCSRCNIKIPYSEKYCNKCKDKIKKEKKHYLKYYDENIRDKKSMEFYNGKEWNIIREQVKQRDNGLCLMCFKDKKIVPYDVVHHIIELREDYSNRINKDNLVCLCHECHNIVHTEYKRSKRNKEAIQVTLLNLIKEK